MSAREQPLSAVAVGTGFIGPVHLPTPPCSLCTANRDFGCLFWRCSHWFTETFASW